MLFWKYLREFLIFRWLFGSDRHEEHTGRTQSNTDHVDCNHDAYCDYDRHSHDGHSHSYYDPLEDPDDFDDSASRYRGQDSLDYYDSIYDSHDDYGSSYGDYDDYDSRGSGFDDFDSDYW